MTGTHDDYDEGRRGDPVDRFFAEERARVPPSAGYPSGDLHWQGIVRSARARRRSRFRGYAVGAAAAAVVVGSVATGAALTHSGLTPTPPTAAGPTAASMSPSPTAQVPSRTGPSAPSSPATSGRSSSTRSALPTSTPRQTQPSAGPLPPQAAASVPPMFTVRSVSNAGKGVLYALGSARCGGSRCPTLARSANNGATWATVHIFVDAQAGSTAAGPTVQSAGALTQVRFASPDVGWVFGGGARVTRDGGRTWHDYPHVGDVVLSLETDASTVTLAGAARCAGGACDGPLTVSTVPVSAGSALATTGSSAAGGRLTGARVALDGGRAYVDPTRATEPADAHDGARLTPSGLAPVARPAGCPPGATSDLTTTAGSPGTLLAFCPVDAAAGSVGYDVGASSDGGATWSELGPRLRLLSGPDRSFAAADRLHLVAATGGDTGRRGSLVFSSDAGGTWAPATVWGGAPVGGWRWVGAAGGGTYYAVAVGPARGFWRSTDFGAHWSLVTVR